MTATGGSAVEGMPDRIGRYEVILPIASGGMATIFLVRTTGVGGFDRYLALKLTAPHLRRDPAFAFHLIEEAKLVAHLRHTNVVQAFDVGECEYGVYLVMEYVPGDSFSGLRRLARAAGTKLPRGVGLRILLDTLQGLHAAHEHADEDGNPYELVHRDVSPQNILVGTDGIARLTDFGIAKAASRISNTEAGLIKGKMTYMAPEQARGDALDRRCDVWAAGVIAWEVLAERKLYDKNDPLTMLSTRPDPPRLKTVTSDVTDDLDDIVARALRVDRTIRTSNARDLLRELTAAARAAHLLADADEVAAHVARLAGPELAERKARLAQVRREQQPSPPGSNPGSNPDVSALGLPSIPPLPQRRPALASLPEVPIAAEDDASELRIAVDLGGADDDRANMDILGQPVAAIPDEEPSIFRSPVAPAVSQTGPLARLRAAARGLAEEARNSNDGLVRPNPLETVAGTAKKWSSPPWTPKKVSFLAAIGGGVLGFVFILVAVIGGKSKTDSAAGGSSSAGSSSVGSTGTTGGPPTTVVAPTSAATTASADEVTLLRVTANGPISSVRIGDRLVDSVVPAPTVSIDLEDDEQEKALRIVVTSTDGRIATMTTEPSSRELTVTFGERQKPTPAPTVKYHWGKRGSH